MLPDGRAVIAGGYANTVFAAQSATEIYDPATGAWTREDSLRHPRSSHIAEVLQDGSLLVAGGYGGDETVERLHPRPGGDRDPHAGRHGLARADRRAHRHTRTGGGAPGRRGEAREAAEVARRSPARAPSP